MSLDVVNEIVSHFAGYFRIADEVARDRLEYLEGGLERRFDDYTVPLPETPFKADLEPFDSRPSPQQSLTAPEGSGTATPRNTRPARPESSPESDESTPQAPPRPSIQGAGGGGGGGGHAERQITVTYEEDGTQRQVEVRQVNYLEDNDLLLVGRDTGVTELNEAAADSTAILQEMREEAAELIPVEMELPRSAAEIPDFLLSRDAAGQEGDAGNSSPVEPQTGDDHSVEPGLYVNGELQDQDFEVSFPELSPPDEELPATARGEVVDTGSNTAVNAALIVDLNEGAPTMIVLGDYFSIEAIVQTYSYRDNDDVSAAGPGPIEIDTHGSSADNIARFDHQASIYSDLDLEGQFSGWNWNVHVVQGDFYDINLLIQEIYLSDEDVTVQESHESLYEVYAGGNRQFNLAELTGGNLDFDLIIIGGNYHGGNYIFQHTFLLDDDIAMLASSDGEPVQTVGTGGNTLLNYAAIHTWGNEVFVPLSEEAESLVSALSRREPTLDPDEHGFVAPAVGPGDLNVLYVTGDYYDINAIWQYITVADADTALQLLSAQQALETSADGDETIQNVQTGSNTLLNDATIADVGTGSTQVGGEVYTDTILVQAELVAETDDTVARGNSDALVSELIAFIGTDENEDQPNPPASATAHPEDMLGGVLA